MSSPILGTVLENDGADDENENVPVPSRTATPMPFDGLEAPQPLDARPDESARWIAFGGILLGGLLGGLIGYGVGDLLGESSLWAAVGGLVGAVSGSIGVGIISSLTLRAMNEWHAVRHPEDPR